MTEKGEEDYRKNNKAIIIIFGEKNIESVKLRDPCHLTGIYRSPAHSKFKIIVTQDQCSFAPF